MPNQPPPSSSPRPSGAATPTTSRPYLVALVVALVALAGVWLWFNPISFSKKTATNANTNAATEAVNLPDKYTYQGQDGKNALDLLKEKYQIIEQDGFVQGIEGRVNTKTTFWLYYVNGQPAGVGAKDYVTKSSDTIEWRFEETK